MIYDPKKGYVRNADVAQLDVFTQAVRNSQAAIDAGKKALALTEAKNVDTINLLIPLATEIAEKAGASGVTVSDLRIFAVQRGLLTGDEKGKQLSFLGAVMKRAGLVNTGRVRRSPLVQTHGIRQVVWVHSRYNGGSNEQGR